jgi:hypothetical protein
MSGERNESDRWRGQSAYILPIRGARCDQPNRGLTPVYQRDARAFKRSTLLAPYRWLSEEGVKHARALLTDTARKFTEIASAWSFADQGYFSGVFSASTSVTPQSFQAGEPTRSQRSTGIEKRAMVFNCPAPWSGILPAYPSGERYREPCRFTRISFPR